MAKAAEKKEETTVTVKTPDEKRLATFGDLLDETPVDARDFLIPKLLLMQSQSKPVKEEKSRAGEIRGSLDLNKVAEKEGEVEIIAFSVYKTWVTLTKGGGEFVGQEPLTVNNCTRPRDEIRNGVEVENFETLNYFCLLPSEIATGSYLPYVVSFRSTSYMAGKALETHRLELMDKKIPLPFRTFRLGSSLRTKDKNTFYAFTIGKGRETTEEELLEVSRWNALVKQGKAKVDETEFQDRAAAAKPVSSVGTVHEGDQY